MMRLLYSTVAVLAASFVLTGAAYAEPPRAESFLKEGRTREGIPVLSDYLKSRPADDQVRFELGTLQFVSAVENVGRNFYRFGIREHKPFLMGGIPLLRLPVPVNPEPEKISYEDSRRILQQFIDELAAAEKTFAGVQRDDVKMSLRVLEIQFDFTGKQDKLVPLSEVLKKIQAAPRNPIDAITFDRTDVVWIRGYCHLLSALCETVLAYDSRELFDSTAQLFFTKVETAYPFLSEGRSKSDEFGGDLYDIADLIAFIHLLRMPVTEPKRMEAALGHFEKCLSLSHEMWKQCLAETDDDNEWIPNPKQHGVLGIKITQPMIDSWRAAAEEGQEVLAGKRLIPFWRGNTGKGVNLRRVFTEPRAFDIVLWIQGTAAAPYLEEGPKTQPAVWNRLQQVFQGNFINFAIWVN